MNQAVTFNESRFWSWAIRQAIFTHILPLPFYKSVRYPDGKVG